MQQSEFKMGVIYALIAYSLWGIAPLYFKLIQHISAPEILMHRVIWSFLFLLMLVAISRQFREVAQLFKLPKQLLVLALTSLLIAANWLIFIWAVNNNMLLEASLGYFINPLFNVVLGMVFLNERLPRLQLIAVAIAALGVLIQLVVFGSIPWLSLALATTFGLYGLLKKKIKLKAVTGLFMETAILLPAAVYYWWQLESDTVSFTQNAMNLNVTLICAGIVTTLPLLAFSAAAVRIPYYMLGLFQYIGPSVMFILAVTLFSQILDQTKLTTFGFIWGALIIFVFDVWRQSTIKKRLAK
jgi:chloramphenicol-sensitive protein RarD